MTELNIKKEIGKRIFEARKAKGLTLKALGELAGNLKQTRLTNWEQGTRAPGPEEIKLLATALDVSPAFLMCLSDELAINKPKSLNQLIPLLDSNQACDGALYLNPNCEVEQCVFISVSPELIPKLSESAFALKIADESMTPEVRMNDVLIVDPQANPRPGDFVVALLEGEQEVIVRKFKQLSASKDNMHYELIALNEDWADVQVGGQTVRAQIIGCCMSLVRELKINS